MSPTVWIIIGILAYAAFMTWHGMSSFKAVSGSSEEFYQAGKGVNPFVLLCTTAISVFSGLSYYGYPAAIYRDGIGFYSGTGGYVTGLLFVVLGYRLWLLGKEYGFATPSDYLRERYYSEGYGMFVAVLMVFFIVPYVALQLIAVGNGIETTTKGMVPYVVAVAIGTICVSLHIIGGGMRSVAWLDTFHFILGVGTLLILMVYLITTYFPEGGLIEAAQKVASNPDLEKILSHPGPRGNYTWRGTLSTALSGAVVTIVWPHIFTRCYIARSKDNFKFMAWGLPLAYGIVFSMLAIIGAVLAPAIVGPGLQNTDGIMALLATDYAPPLIAFLSLLCLFAFAVSTADSMLLSASAMASRDLYAHNKFERKGLPVDAVSTVRFGRLVLLALLLATIVVCAIKPIYIVDYAYKLSSPMFAMIFPATVGGLFWRRGTREGAWAGTLGGLLVTAYFTFFAKGPFGLSNIVWGLLVNTSLYMGVSLITKVPAHIVVKYFTRVDSLINSGTQSGEAIESAVAASTNG